MKYKFLRREDSRIIFEGDYMEIYVPKDYFKKGIASYNGDKINTMGIFSFIVYTQDEKDKGKEGSIHSLKVPMKIEFDYVDVKTANKKKIKPELKEDDYHVFCLEKGNIFIYNTSSEQTAENSKDFIYLLHNGNLPSIIPYEDIIKLYIESITLNQVNLNNPAIIFEIIIAELCRDKKDLTQPFRKEIGKDKAGITQYDYENINLKRLPPLSSTFTAITFEDMNQSLISSIKKNRNGEKEVDSPIEKTIKYWYALETFN